MNLILLYKEIKKYGRIYLFDYSKNSFFEGVYKFLAIIVSPILIKLSPNLISVFSLSISFIGLFLFINLNLELNIVIIFFFISFILDFTDGLIARYQKTTSFYGRFIDGLFDILVIGFLKIIFILYLFSTNQNYFESYYYYLVILLHPIQHLILDRFSAIARWCNEINKSSKIRPYFRDKFLNKITLLLFDLQHLCIFLLLFKNITRIDFMIELYFFISLFASLFSIFLYIYLSKKNFIKVSNQLDNKE